MKGIKKGLAILLVLCTLLSLVFVAGAAPMPQSADADQVQTTAAESDSFYKIVHLDCARKYFSPENIKKIIDNAAAAGFNQVELYLSDNQGFRFALDNMTITTSTGNTYDLTQALGDGYSDGSKYPDYSNKYLTQSEMNDIISYAKTKGIDIVPCINVPGHMGAILEEFTQFRYEGSDSSIDLESTEAVAFALAITEKYASYFASRGVKYYNLGADEYANDMSTMGFQGLHTSRKYQKFVNFLNDAAQIVLDHNMTPRAFNDGIYYNEDNTYKINSEIQVCYWSSGWRGYNLASAQYLVNQGMDVINTHGDYYWVLGNSSWQCDANKASQFDYTSFQYKEGTTGNGKISDPDGAMFCIWCDVGNANGTDEGAAVANATTETIAAFGATLPKSATVDPTPSETPDVSDKKPIKVTVGGTATDTIPDNNYAGTYTTEDPSIATVEVTGTPAVPATTTHTKVTSNPSWESLISSDGGPNSTDYYYLKGGAYYQLYVSRSAGSGSSSTRTYTLGYYENGSTQLTLVDSKTVERSWWGYPSAGSVSATMYTQHNTDPVPASTTVTFTGKAVGTTYVTVGNTRYTIVVEDKAPSNAITDSSISIEMWITNSAVYESKSKSSAHSYTISSSNALTEDGIKIDTVVPETAYSEYDGWIELHFWQAMRLDQNNNQSDGRGDDETADGVTFTHVRYHSGAWQYKTTDGVWHYFVSGDQLVAYYMRHMSITKEITTAMKDWGYSTSSTTPDSSSQKGQVALTVAVVYPDGTVSPAEGSLYSQSTTIFNYDSNWANGKARDIGIIAPLNNSDYTISKITVTDGSRDKKTNNFWYANDTITWNKVTNEAGQQWYDETTYWDAETNAGTNPMINGAASDIRWSAKNTAKLVLIYLEPVHYDTNLIVKWVDDSASGNVISTMEVAVSSEGTPVTFYNGLEQNSELPPEGVGGTFTLDDDAYVINSTGVRQYFSKAISTIPGVADQYKSGLYKYVSADLSADGMTLTLHYSIDANKLSKQYVVDFGLPVNVPLSDLVKNANDVHSVEITSGSAKVNDDKSITYQPAGVMSGTEMVRVKVNYANSTQTITIGFAPATTVYYEEGFATYSGAVQGGTDKGNGTQTASVAGSKAHYGYDAAYAGSVGNSNGTVAELNAGGEGRFTFTGTGVDVYARTETASGKVMIYVYSGSGVTMELKRLITVDTRQLGEQSAGGTAYNVPIVSLSGLERGEYTLVMKEVQTKLDNNNKPSYPVYIDGFRVHGTLDVVNTQVYKDDNEANPTFVELRNAVLAGLNVDTSKGEYAQQIAQNAMSQVYASSETTNGAVVLDAKNTTISVNDLLDKGPKNELYLRSGQAVVFKLADPSANVQVGLKALNKATNYSINNGDSVTLNTSTDMFYKVTPDNDGVVAITNNGEGILSITEVKVIGASASTASTFAALSANDLMPALLSMGFESEPVAATATLNITVQCGDKAVPVTLTADGMSGDTHTFTAAEIKAAVEQALPEGYNVDDVTFTDVTVACGESADVSFTAVQTQIPDTPTSTIEKIIAVAKRVINRIIGWFR